MNMIYKAVWVGLVRRVVAERITCTVGEQDGFSQSNYYWSCDRGGGSLLLSVCKWTNRVSKILGSVCSESRQCAVRGPAIRMITLIVTLLVSYTLNLTTSAGL